MAFVVWEKIKYMCPNCLRLLYCGYLYRGAQKKIIKHNKSCKTKKNKKSPIRLDAHHFLDTRTPALDLANNRVKKKLYMAVHVAESLCAYIKDKESAKKSKRSTA